MSDKLYKKIQEWKNSLLDLGKRNRLINFKEGKLNNIKITSPSLDKLYAKICSSSKKGLKFPYATKVKIDEFGVENYETIHSGDVETSKPFPELSKALRNLRLKAKSFIEERGMNALYLTFASVKWLEKERDTDFITSPLLLLPVELKYTSSIKPYELVLRDDEILLNPSLAYKFEHDFNIKLPAFDSSDSDNDINSYFDKIEGIVSNNNWKLNKDSHLTILSFAKITMYNDISKNVDKIKESPIISNLVGISDAPEIDELSNYHNHDAVSPLSVFQVLDADSSQQDAIALAKKGCSFVLQGPPGTGKSQTITNIISEKLAAGKTVLFVSEKLAALNVVYDKLESVDLSDFCLNLHKSISNNSNKKEFLSILYDSITLAKTRTPKNAILDLENLERKRDELNSYAKELHTPSSGLGETIYNINGELAKLAAYKDISFKIPKTAETSRSLLEERKYNLQALSTVISKQKEDFATNVWRNSNVAQTSHELYHDIDSKFVILLPQLEKINGIFLGYIDDFNLPILASVNNINSFVRILELAIKSPIFPFKWISEYSVDELLEEVRSQYKKTQEIEKLQDYIFQYYEASFLDTASPKSALIDLTIEINSFLSFDNNNQLIEKLDSTQKTISGFLDDISSLYKESKCLALEYDMECKSLADILRITNITKIFSQNNISPTAKFFESIDEVKSALLDAEKEQLEVLALEAEILKDFDKEIFMLDFPEMLKDFRCDYNLFIKRVFSKKYWAYLRSIKACKNSKIKINYDSALALLGRLKVIADKKSEVENKKDLYLGLFGNYYNGLNTKWESIASAISLFEDFLGIFKYDKISESLRSKILSQNIIDENFLKFRKISEATIEIGLIENIEAFDIKWTTSDSDCLVTIEILRNLLLKFETLASTFREVAEKRNAPADYDDIIYELTKLEEIQSFKEEVKNQYPYMKECYDDFYLGEDTNWQELISALEYAKELDESLLNNEISKEFAKAICESKETINRCGATKNDLLFLKEDIAENLGWTFALFEESEALGDYNLRALIARLYLCKENKDLLEEWVDYRRNRENCEALGLDNYIEEIESQSLAADEIVPIYLKRFYNLWLDEVVQNFPSVNRFRASGQNMLIEEFRALDKKQFKTAQKRIRKLIIDTMPDFNRVSSTKAEIAILNRELSKHRRIKPIRTLLREIPNLITTLRPCFMMSPLSVSLFLDSGDFKFDTVIFDEASQICTEDAIGAIMRGKQAIIVGDRQQLPPTDFFKSAYAEEYDSDDESEDDVGVYQSILDEAVSNMPERSLKWHYRSRNEELIALSNAKMYNNSLFTFPSPHTKVADTGVEFVYVEDGVYDRGGKRNNIIEARKVADLVFEHFAKYQDQRSLGVVTFSASQMVAIENAILYKRQENPLLDEFFSEDSESPFFVKNIENIQGDERDTIIMSVGYAKDINGKMYNNFGPLAKEGGERRLNVAITRAKHNVKLVSSIYAQDIDAERDTAKKGVKMLKLYLDLAKNGAQVLENELSFNHRGETESPFEEAVYSFLRSEGYDVETQVGCAGYRIDMAIKDRDGNFILGIECDGVSYHSSRTARERDRLRQSVLEEIGWTIYRIWSTDWVKHRESSEKNLLEAINKEINKA